MATDGYCGGCEPCSHAPPRRSRLPPCRRRNPIINQINRFKGCLCVAIFKLLLAMRLDSSPGSPWHDLPVRVICLPYYFAAVFRFVLHFAKEPITPPDGPAHKTAALLRARQPR